VGCWAILILLFGHVLNFALAALGAYVHSVRLIFVEFYNNVNFKGGAKPFKAFYKRAVK
jgi:V/A-type H+-transporting ATPase subunit I